MLFRPCAQHADEYRAEPAFPRIPWQEIALLPFAAFADPAARKEHMDMRVEVKRATERVQNGTKTRGDSLLSAPAVHGFRRRAKEELKQFAVRGEITARALTGARTRYAGAAHSRTAVAPS